MDTEFGVEYIIELAQKYDCQITIAATQKSHMPFVEHPICVTISGGAGIHYDNFNLKKSFFGDRLYPLLAQVRDYIADNYRAEDDYNLKQ